MVCIHCSCDSEALSEASDRAATDFSGTLSFIDCKMASVERICTVWKSEAFSISGKPRAAMIHVIAFFASFKRARPPYSRINPASFFSFSMPKGGLAVIYSRSLARVRATYKTRISSSAAASEMLLATAR